MKLFQKSGNALFTAFLPLFIIICIIIVEAVSQDTQSEDVLIPSGFAEEWIFQSGEKILPSQLPKGTVSLTHSLENMDVQGKDLCFKTANADVKVLFDNETTYTYEFSPSSPLFGKSYGMRIHMVSIPDDASAVTVELSPLYENTPVEIDLISIDESGNYLNGLYQRELPGFAMCALMLLYGVLMLIVGVLTRGTSESSNIDFFSLGAFAILTGIYSANETLILQVFTERPEVVRFSAAVALMFISYFPVSFIASVTHHRDTVLLPVLFTLTVLNFGATVLLSLLGICDVVNMLIFSHICIAFAVISTFYLMFRAAKKKTNDRNFMHTVITGMSFAMAGAGVDLFRYQLVKVRILGNSIFTRVGVLIFVILMGIHLMRERTRIAIERERSSLMEKLAYTDGLTGMHNRLAFHEKEDEIRKERTSCIIVQLDINNLKKVNDAFGHAEGDRHIIGAASIISGSFSELGACYRTGGDEFVVLVQKGDTAAVIQAIGKLETEAEAYNKRENPPVPMQIAYGYAHFEAKQGTFETAEQLADQRMYEKKKQMKANAKK